MRSRKSIPRPTYFFAMLTTSLRFDSTRIFLASASPASILFASCTSLGADKSFTLPISFKYILTGSLTEDFMVRSSFFFNKTFRFDTFLAGVTVFSFLSIISISSLSKVEYIFSTWSFESSRSDKVSLISSAVSSPSSLPLLINIFISSSLSSVPLLIFTPPNLYK